MTDPTIDRTMNMSEGIVRLFLAQKGRCFHCGKPMLLNAVRKKSSGKFNEGWTREHVIPLSHGGPRGLHNCVLAHHGCNAMRGNKPPTKKQLDRAARIWVMAAERDRKEIKQIACDPVLRGTYMACYNYSRMGEPGEPKYTPEMLTRWMK